MDGKRNVTVNAAVDKERQDEEKEVIKIHGGRNDCRNAGATGNLCCREHRNGHP